MLEPLSSSAPLMCWRPGIVGGLFCAHWPTEGVTLSPAEGTVCPPALGRRGSVWAGVRPPASRPPRGRPLCRRSRCCCRCSLVVAITVASPLSAAEEGPLWLSGENRLVSVTGLWGFALGRGPVGKDQDPLWGASTAKKPNAPLTPEPESSFSPVSSVTAAAVVVVAVDEPLDELLQRAARWPFLEHFLHWMLNALHSFSLVPGVESLWALSPQ